MIWMVEGVCCRIQHDIYLHVELFAWALVALVSLTTTAVACGVASRNRAVSREMAILTTVEASLSSNSALAASGLVSYHLGRSTIGSIIGGL